MRILISAALAACVAAPVPVFAVGFADDKDDKMVCRSNREHNVGTRIRAPRVCRTRAEWRQLEERTQEEMQQVRDGRAANVDSGAMGVGGGGPSA